MKNKTKSTITGTYGDTIDRGVFEAAHRAWADWGALRARRHRMKAFTYGRQWGDPEMLNGQRVTEFEAALASGARPQTNNLLRQLVKSIVGRFRQSLDHEDCPLPKEVIERNLLDELDARMMEEFLISGCAVQRVVPERRIAGNGVWIDNVSPDRFFTNRFTDPRCHDLELVGQVHSMSLNEAKMRLGGNDRAVCAQLEAAMNNDTEILPAGISGEWNINLEPGHCCLIEIWALESREIVCVHDKESGRFFFSEVATGGMPTQTLRWRCRWFTHNGILLRAYDSPFRHGQHPFVLKLYPLIDSEIHPFVEDVIDQQKGINRLLTMIDHVMMTSAKSAVLYPIETLPDDWSLQQVADRWAHPGALIPYRGNRGDKRPEVLTNTYNDGGAASLLTLQLRMMEQVSGVSAAMQGLSGEHTTRTSGNLYQAQAENSIAGLKDIFDTFNSFRQARNSKVLAI